MNFLRIATFFLVFCGVVLSHSVFCAAGKELPEARLNRAKILKSKPFWGIVAGIAALCTVGVAALVVLKIRNNADQDISEQAVVNVISEDMVRNDVQDIKTAAEKNGFKFDCVFGDEGACVAKSRDNKLNQGIICLDFPYALKNKCSIYITCSSPEEAEIFLGKIYKNYRKTHKKMSITTHPISIFKINNLSKTVV